MIDLTTKSSFKVKEVSTDSVSKITENMLVDGEDVALSLDSKNYKFIFTNHRLIIISMFGLTSSKMDITFIPYDRILLYSIETKGNIMDNDSKLVLNLSNIGNIYLNIVGETDIRTISRLISESLFN